MLVNPMNASFAEQLTTKSRVDIIRVDNADHLVHLTHTELVNNALAKFVADVGAD